MPTRKSAIQPIPRSVTPSPEPTSAQDLAFPSVRITNRSRSIRNLKQIPHRSYHRMLELVRLGAYDHVASAALGITPSTFARWMKEGGDGKDALSRKFYLDVMEARNQARALAEIEVKKTDPKFWLTRGPGKHSQVFQDAREDGQVEETVLPGWEDVTHVEVSQPPSPFFAQGPATQLPTATPLQEFAQMLQAMEELNILQLTDQFRAASALRTTDPQPAADANTPLASPSPAPSQLPPSNTQQDTP